MKPSPKRKRETRDINSITPADSPPQIDRLLPWSGHWPGKRRGSGMEKNPTNQDERQALLVLLTVSEVAKRCSVSTKTVRRWIKDRGLRTYRPPGGRLIRISEDDLATFIKNEQGD
jgi:excisionase family DNA binding protein